MTCPRTRPAGTLFLWLAVPLVALLVLPVATLAWVGLTDTPLEALCDPDVGRAIRLSLQTSTLSMVLVLATGTPLAALGITVPFSTTAVVLAQVFVAGPFFVRAARVGFAALDPAVREAAFVDGATEGHLFRHIALPCTARALGAGLVLAWARALGEFGATIFFAGNREGVTQTMPLAIFVGFESNLDVAVALSLALLGASVVVLLAVGRVGAERAA